METVDFEHRRVYFKQFGAERVKLNSRHLLSTLPNIITSLKSFGDTFYMFVVFVIISIQYIMKIV